MTNLSQIKLQRNSKTHVLLFTNFSPLENRIVYEIIWENEPFWPQMAIWRMRIACWITKAIDARSEYLQGCW